MGVGRTILLAVVGPLLVYCAFLGHVTFRHFVETPGPIEVQVSKMSRRENVRTIFQQNNFNFKY